MATISHNFVSAIADDATAAAAGEVLPSHWNALHTFVLNDADAGVGTYLVSGATIAWQSGYIYQVGAATYYLNGTYTTSTSQTVTLTSAHATLDRIDVLVLDSAGVLSAVAGTAASSPAEPSIDPAVYLRLGIVLVVHNTTAPTITTTTIYAENVEWTATASAGSIVTSSTNNPRGGTKDIEGTAVATNAYVEFVKPAAGTVDMTTQTNLVFYIRVKATWAATKSLRVAWYNGTTLRGVNVTVGNGQYGFNSANTGVYQQIVIPTSVFLITAAFPVTTLRITVIGAGTAPGFYIDDIALQAGVATVVLNGSRAVVTDVAGSFAVSTTTAAEIGYVGGVTSAIQTQLDAKAPLASPTFTGTATAPTVNVSGLTASRAVATDGSKNLVSATTTATELGYVNGVTSAIQTQIDAKQGKVIQLACSDESTALTSGAGKLTFRMPYAMTLTAVRASLTVAQTSGSIFTVDINEAGTTVISTKLTIDNTEKTSTTAATAAVISDSAIADDAEITIDIDQVGDGTAKGLKVTLIGT